MYLTSCMWLNLLSPSASHTESNQKLNFLETRLTMYSMIYLTSFPSLFLRVLEWGLILSYCDFVAHSDIALVTCNTKVLRSVLILPFPDTTPGSVANDADSEQTPPSPSQFTQLPPPPSSPSQLRPPEQSSTNNSTVPGKPKEEGEEKTTGSCAYTCLLFLIAYNTLASDLENKYMMNQYSTIKWSGEGLVPFPYLIQQVHVHTCILRFHVGCP